MDMLNLDYGYEQEARSTEQGLQPTFPAPLLETVARLLAFAFLLCLDADLADELVAVTMARASVGIEPSAVRANLCKWLFGRLRNYYYGEFAAGARGLGSPPALELRDSRHADMLLALGRLTAQEREALVLVEAAGCSMREAAQICRCTPNQFELRLTTARARMTRLLRRPSLASCDGGAVVLTFPTQNRESTA